MNERIEKLAEQAGFTVARGYGLKDTVPKDVFIANVCVSDEMKKFAELIVQECMTMCDNVSADYFKHRKAADDFQDKNIYAEGESACDEVRYEIKKHFGVKE
jgi:hypothetical protein